MSELDIFIASHRMTPTTEQLRRALQVAEQIESLQSQLDALLGGGSGTGAKRGRRPGRPAKTQTSDTSGVEAESAPAKKKRGRKKGARVMSPEARERIAAAQRKRWAKQKKEAK